MQQQTFRKMQKTADLQKNAKLSLKIDLWYSCTFSTPPTTNYDEYCTFLYLPINFFWQKLKFQIDLMISINDTRAGFGI